MTSAAYRQGQVAFKLHDQQVNELDQAIRVEIGVWIPVHCGINARREVTRRATAPPWSAGALMCRGPKIDVSFEMQAAQEMIIEVVESKLYLDGVVCATDVMALAAISTFEEMGVQVPEDVAVVGYDDITLAAYSSPPLTTVSQHIPEAGRVLVESVMKLINGESVPDTILDCDLVVRKTSGATAV